MCAALLLLLLSFFLNIEIESNHESQSNRDKLRQIFEFISRHIDAGYF